jgi:hypothetical protein
MLIGTLFALAAGLMWGLVFVGPLLLPDYPAAFLSFGRYVAFGLIALPLAWMDRRRLAELERSDWLEATRLGLVGNVMYYLFLASAIQRAGGPLPTMIIGTLPVVIAVCSNNRDARRDGRLPWSRLVPSLGSSPSASAASTTWSCSDARATTRRLPPLCRWAPCWPWAPWPAGPGIRIRNADWLRHHPDRSPRAWATAQGLATLPHRCWWAIWPRWAGWPPLPPTPAGISRCHWARGPGPTSA